MTSPRRMLRPRTRGNRGKRLRAPATDFLSAALACRPRDAGGRRDYRVGPDGDGASAVGRDGQDDDDNDDKKDDKNDDKRQVELWWDPPTHVSKDPMRLADGSKTVAELGLWDLDVVRADLVSVAQDDDATKAAQIACIVGAYEAMAVNQGPPTAIQRDLETLLRKHGWQPKKKKRRIHPQPVT